MAAAPFSEDTYIQFKLRLNLEFCTACLEVELVLKLAPREAIVAREALAVNPSKVFVFCFFERRQKLCLIH
jgi:hypothetical protein